MTEPIKSPYVSETKVIVKKLDSKEIIQKGTEQFAMLVKTAKEEGLILDPTALTGFIAGFAGALRIIGIDQKEAHRLGMDLSKNILKVGGLGDYSCGNPDCTNCGNKKKV
jgi:hypothetical protein